MKNLFGKMTIAVSCFALFCLLGVSNGKKGQFVKLEDAQAQEQTGEFKVSDKWVTTITWTDRIPSILNKCYTRRTTAISTHCAGTGNISCADDYEESYTEDLTLVSCF